jgi:hypothetical protein
LSALTYRTQEEADEAWNRRAPAVPVPQSIEQMAVDRYKVVPSHSSMFYPCAVVAGDGQQQLYIGREAECQNMARKFTGAFLDGAFVALAAAPQPPEADHIPDTGKMVAAPVQLPEPVAAESRFTTFAGDRWRWCTVEHARAFGADKGYEVRYLYTEQQVRDLLAASKVERKPLTDEAIRTLYGESDGHWQMVGPQVLCFARSIESVHGIQEQST